jgi:hypothetical protein
MSLYLIALGDFMPRRSSQRQKLSRASMSTLSW